MARGIEFMPPPVSCVSKMQISEKNLSNGSKECYRYDDDLNRRCVRVIRCWTPPKLGGIAVDYPAFTFPMVKLLPGVCIYMTFRIRYLL